MSSRNRLRGSSALAGGLLTALLMSAPALAQETSPPAPQEEQAPEEAGEEASQLGDVVVTGSRIPQNEFTSPLPVQVLTTERASQRGLNDVGGLLQGSTVAAGSPQINSTISSAFVTDGGPGASTVSLRGLGANRTLVLLNGRRAGPAGTRGGVSAFDLNVLPQSALDRVDILKDGASSIYGSDAVAGVVNLITQRARDGGEMEAFYSQPFESGGESANISGSWGRTFDRGYLNISGDYYRQFELKNGDREEISCSEQGIFFPGTDDRIDLIDPRTGSPACQNVIWGQVYVYGPDFSGRRGRFQFDYDGNLGNFIPTRPTNPAVAAQYPNAPAGFYLVNYDAASAGVVNARHPFDAESSLIPETERYTAFIEGAYNVTDTAELYGEFLLNRRESRTNSYRQFWNYTYTSDFLDFYYGPGFGGDPVSGFTGLNFLSPTAITDHFDASQKVDYMRGVVGLRGDFGGAGMLSGWKWDVFAQYSRSDGDYTSDVILQDAVDSTSFKTASCVGSNLPVSGRPCIDVDFTRPGFLAGDLTDAERAFLFDTETGNTVYTQAYVEGFAGGELFDLPAGPLGVALGFHIRRDEIEDVPGEVTLADNSWGLSGGGITAGDDTTREVFAELAIPAVRDLPFAREINLSLSGRFTDTETSGSASTYKVGLNWEFFDGLRLRASHGTSFRAPALFELYLADQTSFPSQRTVDPCLNLATSQPSDRLLANCTNPNGPGGGVGLNQGPNPSSATLVEGGGLGVLEAETSVSTVVGLIWQPTFIDGLSVAVDYYDIEISDQVTSLGSSTVLACYLSDSFPTDPVCDQFDRNPVTKRIEEVRASFLNIASQTNRGIDLAMRYNRDLGFANFTADAQATWTLEDQSELFVGAVSNPNGQIGNPQFVGNLNFQLERGPWTAFWGVDMVGKQANYRDFVNGSNLSTIDYDGPGGAAPIVYQFKAEAEFTAFHSLSLRHRADDWSVLVGVANILDEQAPSVSNIGAGVSTIGTSVLASQYNEAYLGRRAFIRVSKSF
jgi:iron complex outermembrane receptor protein